MLVTTMLAGAARQGALQTVPAPSLSGFGPPLLAVPAADGRATASWYTGFGWLLEPAHEQRQGAMRIEPTRTRPAQAPPVRQAAEPSEQPAGARRPDTVELSDGAESLRRAREDAAAAPDVRAERVAAIKGQIQAGAYQIDDTALAEKLLDVL
jgi:negative regulator of flagellin synthesis FlgM